MLRFKQREHVGSVLGEYVCGGVPVIEMLVWEDGRGFMGQEGFMFQSLLASFPLLSRSHY